ncbi:hypothetical protein [Bdellovibrio sp. NC01]|uniref:hypothetical protein n=1 Tax=Bdellovibrio sp. NC01 TaxID=2220073 RepID=UPI00115AA3AF|nr:hypothetical protein [Bdellovibrio sp. NC01]QDK36977.1 hypothetical protein DOE51_04910 [Bdellovibrio sp. NC01]
MNKILSLFAVLSVLVLSSCTSNESQVKKLALADAETQFNELIQKEADEYITQSEFLKNAYVSYMKKNSEFEIDEVTIQNENLAVAAVKVTTYPPVQRKLMVKIAGTVNPSRERQFNFGNAIQLIREQTGQTVTSEKIPAGVFKYHKNSKGDWLLEK